MVQLIKIQKLEEMTKYEDPKTSSVEHGGKRWTKGVPIILINQDGQMIHTDHWVYINKNGELVYNKKKNLWTQGWDYYDKGKSHIKEVYVVVQGEKQEDSEVAALKSKIKGLEESLKIYKEENDNYEQSTHIDEYLYELNVNEKGEIPCLIKVNGVEHSFGITEKDAKAFVHLFEMHKKR